MQKLTSYHLKIIAIIAMCLDHALKVFSSDIFSIMKSQQIFTIPNYIIFMIILAVGKIAFPLFTYMIAEGCHYTHNIKKYISRLLILGIISEIPFQYMISILQNQPYQLSFTFSNVFFTLALGAIAIEGYRYIKENNMPKWASCLPIMICAVIAQILNTDYAAPGVLLIFLWHFYRETKHWYYPAVIFSILLYLGYMLPLGIMNYGLDWLIILEGILHTLFSLLSLVFISRYNHERGKPIKWFFYLFYPLHIILICSLYYLVH